MSVLFENKSECCGCRACEQACPTGAIIMLKDNEGFLYPEVNKSSCINCGKCRKVCPVLKSNFENSIKSIYAVQNKDKEVLFKSTSGGVFAAIAAEVLNNGGVVFGCVLKDNYAIITSTTTMDNVKKMQGSKYVSSDTKGTYKEVKKFLETGKTVFYTGTPCQVAGLVSFLGKDYDNLITADFLCHGVPSSDVFCENIRYLENKYKGDITKYKFRDKKLKGWGLVTSFWVNGKKKYEPGSINAYFYGFINGLLNRYSCYSCVFKGINRNSDFTVGDFWGYSGSAINAKQGVSFIAVNSDKGKQLFEKELSSKFVIEESTIEAVAKANPSLVSKREHKIPAERKFIYEYINKNGYKACVKKYLKPSNYVVIKIANFIPPKLKDKLIAIVNRIK